MVSQLTTPRLIPGTRVPMTNEEFWARGDLDDGPRVEWVDGEAIVHIAALRRHVEMSGFAYSLLSGFGRLHDLGSVYADQLAMDLPTRPSVRIPDVLVVLKEQQDRLRRERLMGAADLVWEFLSEDTATNDRRDKFQEYARAGIPEYLMADTRPRRYEFGFYRLNADKGYDEVQPDERGRYHSTVLPGFWIDPNWLWQDPLPDIDEILLRIAGNAYVERILAIQSAIRQERNLEDDPDRS